MAAEPRFVILRAKEREVELERHVMVAERSHGGTEEFGFAVVDDLRLAYVRHLPLAVSRMRVVVIGPIGAERERAHRTIVEFARGLAQRGYEVFRYDHRGHGESEGPFEDGTVGVWSNDAQRVVRHLQTHAARPTPTALVGIRMGALIASELFSEGLGDAAVFFGPADGASLLRDASRRALVANLVHGQAGQSETEDVHALPRARNVTGYSAISAGQEARIDGYVWKPQLVREAASHRFRRPEPHEPRPWIQAELGRGAMSLAGSAAVSLEKDRRANTNEGEKIEAAAGNLPVGLGASSGDDAASHATHALSVHAPRFWESSPQLVPGNVRWFDALGTWFDQIASKMSIA
jgi:alpha/beta superfamily hydrolase